MINQELLVANFTDSKNKLSKIIDDDKFNEAIKKELVYIKNINNDIYAKINNEYIANEFINNYLKNFEDIFNQLSGESFSIYINASEPEPVYSKTFKVNLEHTGINKDQTFDNIVECKFNEEAVTYAKKIIKNNKWSLLCIYGGIGSGKSYILNSVGNLYAETYKNNDVILVNSLKFIQDIFACRKNSELIQNIKNKILKNKCILFDDIQDFNTAPVISEIFLQILHIAKLENKIVVLTSNIAPNEFKHTGKNFTDRINSGMSAIIHSPSLSDKKKFIISELNNSGNNLELTNDALEYLAGRTVDSNLNKLMIMIDKVSVFAETNESKVWSKSEIEKIINTIKIESHSSNASIEIIARYFDVSAESLIAKDRSKEVVFVRDICMYLLHKKFRLTLKKIGGLFGNKAHSAVIAGIKRIQKKIKSSSEVQQQIQDIEKLL